MFLCKTTCSFLIRSFFLFSYLSFTCSSLVDLFICLILVNKLSENQNSKSTVSLQVVEFSSNDEQLSKVIAKLGQVTTSYVFPMLSCAEGPGLSRAKVGHKSTFTVITKDRNGEPCTSGKCISDCTNRVRYSKNRHLAIQVNSEM